MEVNIAIEELDFLMISHIVSYFEVSLLYENKIYKTYPSNPDTDGDGCEEGPGGFDDTSERALDPSYPVGGCP